jgi:hypothetical protein
MKNYKKVFHTRIAISEHPMSIERRFRETCHAEYDFLLRLSHETSEYYSKRWQKLYDSDLQFSTLGWKRSMAANPVTDYTDYQNAIMSSTTTSNLNGRKVIQYIRTTGTLNQFKLFPMTENYMLDYNSTSRVSFSALARFNEDYIGVPTMLFFNNDVFEPRHGVDLRYMSHFTFLWTARRYPFLYPFSAEALLQLPGHKKQQQETLDLLILLGDFRLMGAFPPRYLSSLIERIDQDSQRLLALLETNKNFLQSCFKRKYWSEERYTYVKGLLNGDTALSFANIWPQLKMILVWKDAVCSKQLPDLQAKTNYKTEMYDQSYASTEACFSFRLKPTDPGQTIVPMSNLLEFLDIQSGEIFPPWQIKEGNEYEILLTNSMGLVRYRIKDIVECVGFTNQLPQILFSRKAEESLLLGVRISEQDLQRALIKVHGKICFDWRVTTNESGDGLVFLSNQVKNLSVERIDQSLQEMNSEYRDSRSKGVLKEMVIRPHQIKLIESAQSKPRLIIN